MKWYHNEIYHQIVKVKEFHYKHMLRLNNDHNEQIYESILSWYHSEKVLMQNNLKVPLQNKLIRDHDISKPIISNRDNVFTFNYWIMITTAMRMKLKLSTAFHLKTNEQTKRLNQTLKQYLQHFVSYAQENWILPLSIVQLTLNQHQLNFTRILSFFANFKRHANVNFQKTCERKHVENIFTQHKNPTTETQKN